MSTVEMWSQHRAAAAGTAVKNVKYAGHKSGLGDTHRVKIILGSISKYYSMHRQSFTLSFTFSSGLDSRLSPHTLRCIDTVV